ncbi:MAG: DUF4032 domain-containing protein [Chloroflexi bacterium]|nr:MAG: DUF4032 domain-containing protein [Chloroflexota bacterium]
MDKHPQSYLDFERARRRAAIQDILAALRRRPADLLPFEEVEEKLHLRPRGYRGLEDVPLDKIVGSVGRYQDFNRAFLPRRDALRDRWQRIDTLVSTGGGLPPVELYKVGDVYFVRDGNHRVSVARQHDAPTIQAYVWEFETPVPLEPDMDVDDLLLKGEQADFLQQTHLHQIRPEARIEFTVPGGYYKLLEQIAHFQRAISQIDQRDVPYEEAVALWYEMVYEPVVEIIRESGILQAFPGRTEADLYIWVLRHQQELSQRYGHPVLMDRAATDLAARSPRWHLRRYLQRLRERLARLLRRPPPRGGR